MAALPGADTSAQLQRCALLRSAAGFGVGLLWIVVYYLTQGLFPLVGLGGWNILIGFGLALLGFLMMSRWSE